MSFTADLSKFCKDIAPQYMEKVVRTVVIEIGNRVVLRSPVGDATYWLHPPPPGYAGGRFRGNWQYGFGSIPAGNLDVIDKSGAASTGRIIAGAMGHGVKGVTYLVNNLPYAERLENGWSRQAPQGIVSRVELEFPEIFRRAAT